jgi:virginiamycin B lyase
MRFFKSAFYLLALLTSLVSVYSYAATITGIVKGPNDVPVKGVFVQARDTKHHITTSVLSDQAGKYRFAHLKAGDYEFRIAAVGYRADPKPIANLTEDKILALDWSLERAPVRWSEISYDVGHRLLPDVRGKAELEKYCLQCHSFQSRMAANRKDESGWRDQVNFMREAMHYRLWEMTDADVNAIVSYLSTVFGQDSTLPKSVNDVPEYQKLVRPLSDEATDIVYVEYDMPAPNLMPWSAVPDGKGSLWIPCFGDANQIRKLNPETGETKSFKAPFQGTAGIHSVMPAPDGSVWFTEQGSNSVAKLDSLTQKITEYQDAQAAGKEGIQAGGSKNTLRIDKQGMVWATGGPLSRFDPKTNKFTDFPEVQDPYGITVDHRSDVWFAEYAPDGKIGKIDSKTLKIKKWEIPTPHAMPRRIEEDSDGNIWFGEFKTGKIGRFDPKTERFQEFALPGPSASPYALQIDKAGRIWYASFDEDVVGRLDPKTGHVTEYPFPQSEMMLREFFLDAEGRMWFGAPANNKVGYFYLQEK